MNTPTYSRLTPREVMAARADDARYNKELTDGMKYGRPLSRLPKHQLAPNELSFIAHLDRLGIPFKTIPIREPKT